MRDMVWFLGMGIGSILLFTVCYFTAMSMASLSVAAILLYTAPVMVMLMSLVLFHEKMNRKRAFGACHGIFRLCFRHGTWRSGRISAAAVGIGLLSAFGYGLYSILGTYVLRKYSPLTVTHIYVFVRRRWRRLCVQAGRYCLKIFGGIQQGEPLRTHHSDCLCDLSFCSFCRIFFIRRGCPMCRRAGIHHGFGGTGGSYHRRSSGVS